MAAAGGWRGVVLGDTLKAEIATAMARAAASRPGAWSGRWIRPEERAVWLCDPSGRIGVSVFPWEGGQLNAYAGSGRQGGPRGGPPRFVYAVVASDGSRAVEGSFLFAGGAAEMAVLSSITRDTRFSGAP